MLVYKFSRLFYFLFLLTVLFPITLRAHPITNSTGTLRPNSHGLATSRGGMTATQLCSTTLLFSTITPAGKGCAPSQNRSPMKGKNRRRSSSKTNPVVLEKRAGNKQGDGGYQRDRGTVSSGTRANQPSAGKSRGNGGGNGDAVAVSMPYFSGGEGIPASSIHSVGSSKKARSAGKDKKRKTDKNSELEKARLPAVGSGAENSVETSDALAQSLQAMSLGESAAVKSGAKKSVETAAALAQSPQAVSLGPRATRAKRQGSTTRVNQNNFLDSIRDNPDGDFVQVENINLNFQTSGLPAFSGTYNGGGHKISDIRQGAGLFARLNRAEVSNLLLARSFPRNTAQSYVSGNAAGLLAGSSSRSRVSGVKMIFGGVNADSSAPEAATSGVLVGTSTYTEYTDIAIGLGAAGKPGAQDEARGTSGGIIGSGNHNTFTNILTADAVARGEPAGAIVGSGTNNTIRNVLVDASDDRAPAKLVGFGSYTLINGVVYGDSPPYNLAGANVSGFLGYNNPTEPPVVRVGDINEVEWRVGPNLASIPRSLDGIIRFARSELRTSNQPDCTQLACAPTCHGGLQIR